MALKGPPDYRAITWSVSSRYICLWHRLI